jgi:hypothetical protein
MTVRVFGPFVQHTTLQDRNETIPHYRSHIEPTYVKESMKELAQSITRAKKTV